MTSTTSAVTTRPSSRTDHLAVPLILLVLAVALGTTTAWWAGSLSDVAADSAHRARWAELVMVVHQTSAVLEDELNAWAAAALEDADAPEPTGPDLQAAAQARSDVLTAVLPSLEEMADSARDARVARQLREVLAEVPLSPDVRPAMEDVLSITAQTEDVMATAAGADAWALALLQLAGQASIPRLVVSDQLDATYVLADGQAAASSQAYFDGAEAYLLGDGGWLEPGPDGQLISPYIPADDLREQMPDVWADLRTAMDGPDAATLLAVDDWVQRWPQSRSEPPPAPIDVTLDAAAAVSDRVDALIDATTQRITGAERAAAASASQRRVLVLVVGSLLTALVAALAVRSSLQQWGHIAGWRSAALTDPLTGLANRRALQTFAEARGSASAGGSALLLFDIDHFKAINDQFGHATGDQALVAIAEQARRIAEDIPHDTLVARLGGDEFVIMAHGLSDAASTATDAAAAMVAAVKAIALPSDQGPVPLSISLGVAAGRDTLPLDDLLLQADSALYDVKRGGRGTHRPYVAPEDLQPPSPRTR